MNSIDSDNASSDHDTDSAHSHVPQYDSDIETSDGYADEFESDASSSDFEENSLNSNASTTDDDNSSLDPDDCSTDWNVASTNSNVHLIDSDLDSSNLDVSAKERDGISSESDSDLSGEDLASKGNYATALDTGVTSSNSDEDLTSLDTDVTSSDLATSGSDMEGVSLLLSGIFPPLEHGSWKEEYSSDLVSSYHGLVSSDDDISSPDSNLAKAVNVLEEEPKLPSLSLEDISEEDKNILENLDFSNYCVNILESKLMKNFTYRNNFITVEEEESLLQEISLALHKSRYYSDKDYVLGLYRSIKMTTWSEKNLEVINRAISYGFPQDKTSGLTVHVLELAQNAEILPHVVCSRCQGDTLVVINLCSPLVMRLQHIQWSWKTADVHVQQRSIYTMSGSSRCHLRRMILGCQESTFKGKKVPKTVQYSIILSSRSEMIEEDISEEKNNLSFEDEDFL